MGLSDKAARGARDTLLGQGLRFLLQLVSVTVLARLLVPSDYGLYSMVFAVVGVASVLGDFGLSMASVQARRLTDGQRNNLFWTNTLAGLVLSVLVFSAAHPIANAYGHPELVGITHAIAPAFLLNALAAQLRAEATTLMRFKALAATDVGAQAVGLVAAVLVARAGHGYWALVTQLLVVAVITLPALALAGRWLPGLPRRGERMGDLYRFGANTLGVQMLVYLTSNIDSILIGRVAGPSALGVYNRAFQLFRLPLQQVAAPLTRVALPVLSQLQDDDERYVAYVHRSQLILTYTFGGFFFVLAAVSGPLVDILLGHQYDAAKKLFLILSLGGVFQAMGYVYYWIFLSKAKTGLQLRLTLVGRLLMVAAMVVGVIWGATGVAIGASVGQALVWGLNTVVALPRVGMLRRPVVVIALRPLALFSVMTATSFVVSSFLGDLGPWTLGCCLALYIAAFLSAAYAVIPAVRRDVNLIAATAAKVRVAA